MPALVARSMTKQDTQTPRAPAPPKKRRVPRRKGRARGELDSDDEIEREPVTDESESENDDIDSLDSATDDSDTEPASEDAIPPDRTHLPTPRNSKSPESVGKATSASFFAATGSWSEMVMEEATNGSAELPVVDFADFGNAPLQHTPARRSKKAPKSPRAPSLPRATAAELITKEEEEPPVTDLAPDRKRNLYHQRHPLPGQAARQLYQQKLETDPSFVPTIGNFWSHDDRLIDTELRNLSGWWRGRGVRGRGRGDHDGRGRGMGFSEHARDGDSNEEIPPVELPWTHDGFEEMKKKDEQRRAEQAAARQAQSSPKRGGGFASRGRGNFVQGRSRGGYTRGYSSPGRPRNNSPFIAANRVRFAMKPELMWTKQHEAFLYFDTAMKARPGQGPGFRVRLPGRQSQVIRGPSTSAVPLGQAGSKSTTKVELGDNHFVVRLPKRLELQEDVTTGEVEGVGSEPVDKLATKLETTQSSPGLPVPSTQLAPEPIIEEPLTGPLAVSVEPTPPEPASLDPPVLGEPSSAIASAVQSTTSPALERPVLPPLQTTFTPPPPPPPQPISQPSPAYGSPYGYTVPLPPGIAMNPHGMPYEVATGRPVYLQPPTMYNPRPMVHSYHPSMQLHPGHMHHHSVSNPSPDFLAHSSSHTPVNGFIDPATGTPIFSFPRQTSRIEIRAPGDPSSPVPAKPASKASGSRPPSSLRMTSSVFQPASTRMAVESSEPSGYYLPSATPSDSTLASYDAQGSTALEDPAVTTSTMGVMMHHYPQPYAPQQYYYPETYGYPQYMDMSHPGQTYDMYGMEQTPQGTVYY